MKRGIAEHPKTKRLARRLAIPIPYAVGLVEMLCNQWAPRVAIQGDIGKWPDEDIADGLGFPGDPAALIEALVGAGWVDRHPVHRLVIHDWHEHADTGVRNRLKKAGLPFVSGVSHVEPESHPGVTHVEPASDAGSPGTGTGTGTGTGKGSVAESAETSSESAERLTAGARVAEPEPAERAFEATHLGIDPELLAAAFTRFPQLTGRRQVVAYAWDAAKSGGPPRDLAALDHLARQPLAKILAHLAHYLASTEPKFHSFGRFVETFGDHDPDTPASQAVDRKGRPLKGSMGAIHRVGQDLGVLS